MNRPKTEIEEIFFTDLKHNKPFNFDLCPSPQFNQALSKELGVSNLSKLRLKGTLSAFSQNGWLLKGHLGATVVQTCVISLEPVNTRIEASVTRKFLPTIDSTIETVGNLEDIELNQDETVEILGKGVNLRELLKEVLLLELPFYPKAEGATLKTLTFSGVGVKTMSDQDARPFAGLAVLKDKFRK